MNILDFIGAIRSSDQYITVTDDMINFHPKAHKKELIRLVGEDTADSLLSIALHDYEKIQMIMARVQPAIDFFFSDKATEQYDKLLREHQESDFFRTGDITAFVDKGDQKFAINGSTAYDITTKIIYDKEKDTVFFARPLISYENQQGRLKYAFPDEGSSGGLASVLYLEKKDKPTHPFVTFFNYRHINTDELNMTHQQIEDALVDEVDRWESSLTGDATPGW